MSGDICMAIGVVLAILSVPAFLSAITDHRSLFATGVTAAVAAGLITWAVIKNPGVYSFLELPNVFIRIAALII